MGLVDSPWNQSNDAHRDRWTTRQPDTILLPREKRRAQSLSLSSGVKTDDRIRSARMVSIVKRDRFFSDFANGADHATSFHLTPQHPRPSHNSPRLILKSLFHHRSLSYPSTVVTPFSVPPFPSAPLHLSLIHSM